MEKSYELAAKYMGERAGRTKRRNRASSRYRTEYRARDGKARHCGTGGTATNGVGAATADERCGVHAAYSQPRNYGFNTAVGSGYAMGKNTIRACIHQDQTIMDGQTVKLRLLEPLQAGNLVIPQNTLVSGTGKVQGERLDIVVSSIEYRGNLLPVELAVYDSDGRKACPFLRRWNRKRQRKPLRISAADWGQAFRSRRVPDSRSLWT